MKPAASMNAASTACRCGAVEPAIPAYRRASVEFTTTAHGAEAAVSAAIRVAAAAINRRPTAIKSTPAVIAMEPRTRANEDATRKVVGTVVAVRRTGIWGIPIIAVGACRGRPDVARSNSNTNSHPNLRMGGSRHYHAKPE